MNDVELTKQDVLYALNNFNELVNNAEKNLKNKKLTVLDFFILDSLPFMCYGISQLSKLIDKDYSKK